LPFPANLSWPDASPDQLREIAANSRIALGGFGADPALSARITVHFRQLLASGKFARIIADAARYFTRPGRLSRFYIRHRWQRLFPAETSGASYPAWLNPDLEKKFCLRERWAGSEVQRISNRSARPEAYDLVVSPTWPSLFECMDPGVTRLPVEVLNPFFDTRLLQFLLGLPSLPWCCDKEIMREAARGLLPDAVCFRRKSPLLAEPLVALLQEPDSAWVDRFEPAVEMARYVVRSKIPPVFGEKHAWPARVHLRPLSLNYWLRHRDSGW
jgi:hypothetical protein